MVHVYTDGLTYIFLASKIKINYIKKIKKRIKIQPVVVGALCDHEILSSKFSATIQRQATTHYTTVVRLKSRAPGTSPY